MSAFFHQEVVRFGFEMGEKALRVGQHSLGHTPSCGDGERRGVRVREKEGRMGGEEEGGWEGERRKEEEREDSSEDSMAEYNTAYMLKSSGFSTLKVSLNSFFEDG